MLQLSIAISCQLHFPFQYSAFTDIIDEAPHHPHQLGQGNFGLDNTHVAFGLSLYD